MLWCALSALAAVAPNAFVLPSFAPQTGQACAACHAGGDWPQFKPWGRFYDFSGYTSGKVFADRTA